MSFGKRKEATSTTEIKDITSRYDQLFQQKMDSLKNQTIKLSKVVDSLKNIKPIQAKDNSEDIKVLNKQVDDLKNQIQIIKTSKETVKEPVEIKSNKTTTSSPEVKKEIATEPVKKIIGTDKVFGTFEKGYYIIAESSKNKELLLKDVQEWKAKGLNAVLISNNDETVHYISVGFFKNMKSASVEAKKVQQKTAPKAWIYTYKQ